MQTPDNINQLLEIASLILYKFTENKETWTEYDTLAQALENTPTTNTHLQIKINARTQEFRRRQITQRTTHYERTQRDSQINSQRDQTDPLVQEILTAMPDQLLKDRPHFYYYAVPKTPQDMTQDELIQEIQAANQAHAQAEINQSGISTKETVRKRHCETELVSRPNGINRWNKEFAHINY